MNQKGYVIPIVLVVFAILIGLMIFPMKFPVAKPEDSTKDNGYCHDLINGGRIITVPSTGITYQLIKESVPVTDHFVNDGKYNHYGSSEDYQDPETGKKYVIRDLGNGGSGRSYNFASDLDPSRPYDIAFADYGVIMLFESDDQGQPLDKGVTATFWGGTNVPLLVADIYKKVDSPPLPEWVLKCQDLPTNPDTEALLKSTQNSSTAVPIKGPSVVVPEQQVSAKKDQLQLEWFLFEKQKYLVHNWWTPHCKPAVYLYPEKRQLVNVKVFPKGELSYTDPPYDKDRGWTVWAEPDSRLQPINDSRSTIYDYLYYESKIRDEEIHKPAKGWVVKPDELESLFNNVLPELGLNKKEQADFMNYWLTKLPDSPYYFVGLVEKPQRDYLEALVVTPSPDTSIRFSLYFEMLDQPKFAAEPIINTPVRNGFTLVDWGGMIKLHPGTPFTCSQ